MPETTGELLPWKGSPPLRRLWGERSQACFYGARGLLEHLPSLPLHCRSDRKTLAPLEPKAATPTGKKQASLKGEAGRERPVQSITSASVGEPLHPDCSSEMLNYWRGCPISAAGAHGVVSLNLSALRQQAAESDMRVLEITLRADRYGSVRSGDTATGGGVGSDVLRRDEIELQFAPVTVWNTWASLNTWFSPCKRKIKAWCQDCFYHCRHHNHMLEFSKLHFMTYKCSIGLWNQHHLIK